MRFTLVHIWLDFVCWSLCLFQVNCFGAMSNLGMKRVAQLLLTHFYSQHYSCYQVKSKLLYMLLNLTHNEVLSQVRMLCPFIWKSTLLKAFSSVVEHRIHLQKVQGSIPGDLHLKGPGWTGVGKIWSYTCCWTTPPIWPITRDDGSCSVASERTEVPQTWSRRW